MIYYTARIMFLLFVILFLGTVVEIFAAAGDLDGSFGEDGIVITDNGFDLEGIRDLVVQSDGKILAVGYSQAGQNPTLRSVIVRYNPNGSIDSTFGSGGKVIIQLVSAGKLSLQPDGKIVFVGTRGEFPSGDFYVARLNSDGSFDTTFNGTGAVNVDLRGTGDRARSVKIQPDGKIVVGGTSLRPPSASQEDYAIVRFNANGSLDTTFDGDGKVFTEILVQNQFGYFSEMDIQPDGKIVAVGTRSGSDFQEFLIIRYNSNGSLDTTFDGDGIVATRFDMLPTTRIDAFASAVVLQPDGKIVVAGTAAIRNPSYIAQAALVRYNTDGSLDSSFANGGKAQIIFPPFTQSSASDVAIQADNKIVIAGYSGNSNEQQPAVARLNADGSLDSTFSGDGSNVIVGTRNRFSPAYAVAIQPGGKIIIGGFSGWNLGSDFMLLRFEGSTCMTNCAPRREVMADFDGDGKTDLSVFRNGTWIINPSSANNPNTYSTTQFGFSNPANLTPADFDGDGKTDIAVWRTNYANSAAAFLILRSSTNTLRVTLFGITGDDPRVVGDWDYDGRADVAVYRAAASAGAQSFFYYFPSSAPENYVTIPWGTMGDEAVRGDFDGDGRMDAAVFRPSDGVWYILQSSNNQPHYERWGLASDKRVSGDFDGDGKTDLAVYRDGLWAILQSSNNQPRYAHWGLSGDWLVAGDYDGDGRTDFAVWRAGVYYILQNSNLQAVYHYFGFSNDIPVASAFAR